MCASGQPFPPPVLCKCHHKCSGSAPGNLYPEYKSPALNPTSVATLWGRRGLVRDSYLVTPNLHLVPIQTLKISLLGAGFAHQVTKIITSSQSTYRKSWPGISLPSGDSYLFPSCSCVGVEGGKCDPTVPWLRVETGYGETQSPAFPVRMEVFPRGHNTREGVHLVTYNW